MKNVWKIFQRDMMRVRNNVIALVVIIGISVVPCLYAWFNIAASWDPYSNTGNLKVAVASVDEGYEGSLIPIEINIGDKVLSALRENTQMEWVFTTEEKATSGVKSGKYYAAIVIPKDFSNKMMSVFSEKVEKSIEIAISEGEYTIRNLMNRAIRIGTPNSDYGEIMPNSSKRLSDINNIILTMSVLRGDMTDYLGDEEFTTDDIRNLRERRIQFVLV